MRNPVDTHRFDTRHTCRQSRFAMAVVVAPKWPEIVRLATMPGLGTSIVEALAKQLDARVAVSMTSHGTSVSITHGTFGSRLPAAA
jgi:chemotaxis protein methyltransferase CheR